jgi:dTDP-4-dehydrorhamnose 3,5-epimerase
MIFRELALGGVFSIELNPYGDERGQFVRTWCRDEFSRHGIDVTFAETAASINPQRETMRGLHWQDPPHEESKLVRCTSGAIYDVIADIRWESPTYAQWVGVTLTPQSQFTLFVPAGYAHGFQTLVDGSEVSYQISAAYVPSAARGVRYDDPVLAIDWPLPVSRISDKVRSWQLLQPKGRQKAGVDTTPGLSAAG